MCKRYQRPPWVTCERESKELLALCLQKVKGLSKTKLVDAAFIWTEPHSRRIQLKLTVQKECLNSLLQKSFKVEFLEHYMQCEDCKKEFTPHTWGASVQVRQKVRHKKTFFFLEQLMLKHNAHDKVLKVEQKDDGLDFFYQNKTQAQRLVDFLAGFVPSKVKMSKQLISHDMKSNAFNYKFIWSLEIPRICKDDLVVVPPALCRELGGVSSLCLCTKVTKSIQLMDTFSLKVVDLNST